MFRRRARPVCKVILTLGLAAAEQSRHATQSHLAAVLLLTMR